MEAIKITKRELTETARFQKFTGYGCPSINVIWFDWKSGEYVEDGITKHFVGAKYMVAVIGTKREAINYMHQWLTQGFAGLKANVKTWVATEDKYRRKMPLSINWSKL